MSNTIDNATWRRELLKRYYAIPNGVESDFSISDTAFRVYSLILKNCCNEAICYLTNKEISESMNGISDRQVRRVLLELESHNYIRRKEVSLEESPSGRIIKLCELDKEGRPIAKLPPDVANVRPPLTKLMSAPPDVADVRPPATTPYSIKKTIKELKKNISRSPLETGCDGLYESMAELEEHDMAVGKENLPTEPTNSNTEVVRNTPLPKPSPRADFSDDLKLKSGEAENIRLLVKKLGPKVLDDFRGGVIYQWYKEFCAKYPKPNQRGAPTAMAFVKALSVAPCAEIMAGAVEYATFLSSPPPAGSFVPLPKDATTWLNNLCWTTEYDTAQPEPTVPKPNVPVHKEPTPTHGNRYDHPRGCWVNAAGEPLLTDATRHGYIDYDKGVFVHTS